MGFEVPERAPTAQDIWAWAQLQKQLKELQEQEGLMRRFLAKGMFPALTEGTETLPLGEGWVLKCSTKVNRTLDKAVLNTKAAEWHAAGVPLGELIEQKPALVMKAYRKLPAEMLAIFSECITEKPGLATLELVAPKAAET